jgi:alkylhydroperoxidase/carboxymuconolactone decarboxylase family protein YurZ
MPDTCGPWDEAARALLEGWDPKWAAGINAVVTSPWQSGVLPLRLVELISLAIAVACTNLDAEGTRRHVARVLAAGASRDEIVFVLKCATVMAIHSASVAAPILLEEAAAAGLSPKGASGVATPACDQMKAMGQWNSAWDPFFTLDPAWTDAFMVTGAGIYASGVLPAKEVELLSIAFDASFTHLYVPGIRRHIRAAIAVGASMEEIFEVLKLCVAQGVAAINLGAPILAEALNGQD